MENEKGKPTRKGATKKRKAARDKGVWIKKRADGKEEIYARIVITEDGVKRPITQKADDISHARRLVKELREKHKRVGTRGLEGERMTFRELVAYMKEHYYHAAQYDADGEMISGVRGLAETESILADLERFFGSMRLGDIGFEEIKRYRDRRLMEKGEDSKPVRTKNRVNKYLSRLKAMLEIAERKGWIQRNPFRSEKPLLWKVNDVRERVSTPDEERRLLAVCNTERRRHIHALIIAAIYTSIRRGGLFNLKWEDVDFERDTITASHFKGGRRIRYAVPMNSMVKAELEALRKVSQSPFVFQYVKAEGDKPLTTIKTAWRKICEKAGVKYLQFRDLRKVSPTTATELGVAVETSAKVLGHTTTRMTEKHYVNASEEMMRQTRELLETVAATRAKAMAEASAETVAESEAVN
jgi:integrase